MENPIRTARKDGYIQIRVNDRAVLEHRFVMERSIGRVLARHEIVHHLNGNRSDNRLANLVILSNSDHLKHHWAHHRDRMFSSSRRSYAKRCIGCGVTFNGLAIQTYCNRRCGNRVKSKRFYHKNLKHARAKSLDAYYRHREDRMQRNHKYYAQNADRLRRYARGYYQSHLEQCRKASKICSVKRRAKLKLISSSNSQMG